MTAYFRHSFDVADPSFYRNALLRLKYADGAVVFLNGKEIYRGGLAATAANADTMAIRRLAGLERHVFVPVKIDPALLRRGRNVIAAEIHAGSPEYADLGFDLELLANDSGASRPKSPSPHRAAERYSRPAKSFRSSWRPIRGTRRSPRFPSMPTTASSAGWNTLPTNSTGRPGRSERIGCALSPSTTASWSRRPFAR
jgi:hypothetical protein